MGSIEKLVEIMATLRDPENGCPWDLEQDFASIAPYTIEEAYEVADAIDRKAMDELRGELGDLLFQVVFHAQMAAEAGQFTFDDVVEQISTKMVRRHPHVFAGEARGDAASQLSRWEDIKAAERQQPNQDAVASALSGVAKALPALMRAQKLGSRAARVGFDWPDVAGVRAKVDEELQELDELLTTSDVDASHQQRLAEELGDLMFSVVQLARHLGLDSEQVLRDAGNKFERRFKSLEARLASNGDTAPDATPAQLETLWASIKRDE